MWLDKFKPGSIDKYDGSSNLEEFIQVYHTIIEAAEGDDRLKANYLLMTLFGAARSWFINLPESTVHSGDQLCAMFNQNLPFMVKILIGQHKVVKTLIDNGVSLNLIMRKIFIEMGLSLVDLTPILDTFHDIIPG
jgi:hypothetical protein